MSTKVTKTKVTGQLCVGELRLMPIDVGSDLRLHGVPIELPSEFASVGLIGKDGESYLIAGTREEMIREIKAAGYKIAK